VQAQLLTTASQQQAALTQGSGCCTVQQVGVLIR